MSHEKSETVQRGGRWFNVFGAGTPQAGQVLPGEFAHDTMEAAVAAAHERSNEAGQDVSSEFMAAREQRGQEVNAQAMVEWATREQPAPLATAEPDAGQPAAPRLPPAEQSTIGKVMRSAGEVPRAALVGVDRAVRHATDWAIAPLVTWLNENVADLEVPVRLPETMTGQITTSLTEFLVGFIPAMKGMKLLGVTGKITQPLAASAVADFAVRDPHEARLANLWQEMGLPKNVLTEYLAADPEDNAVEGRLKSAAEAVLTGAALEGLLAGARALRAAKWISRKQGDELKQLKARYGELDDETFQRALGDPSQPMLVTKVEPVPAAVGKVQEGLEATAPRDLDEFAKQAGEEVGGVDHLQGVVEKLQKAYIEQGDDAGRTLLDDMAANAPESSGFAKEVAAPGFLDELHGELSKRAAQFKSSGAPTAEQAAVLAARAERHAPDLEAIARGVNINWARVGTEVDVQALMADMAGRFKGSIDEARRGVITHAETEKMADAMDMTVPQLLARRKGQPLNAEELLAARHVWAASGEHLSEVAKRAAATNAGALDQYAFRKALASHYAVQAQVLGAEAEVARAMGALRITAGARGGIERARAIEQVLTSLGGPEASQELARRLAILAQHANPRALAKYAEKGFAAKSFAVVREVWVNGLLSSPATHFVNTMSNTAVMFNQVLERGVAARIGQLRGAQGDTVAPGEAFAMTYALVSGVRDAWRVASKAFKTGETGWSLNKVELPREHALSSAAWNVASDTGLGRTLDFLGTAARVPSRFLGAEDEFFKSIGYRMELHARALRQATEEGLAGEALGKRMAQLVNEPTEHLRIAAADAALYNTFTQQPGAIGQAFMRLRERVPAITFILPFIRTPTNIARYTFERSPFAPLVGQWRDDIAAGGARADIALARMAVGSTVMLSALDWADSGVISGFGPRDPGERAAWLRSGKQPYSVHVGGRTFSFNRADPFGALIGFAGDVAEATRRGEMNEDDLDEWQEVVAAGTAAVAQVAVNKQYLRGLSDFFEYMGDPTRYGEGYLNNLFASFLPFTALAGAAERAVDPTVRDVVNPWEALSAKVAGLSSKLPPRLDLWGREIRAESGLGKAYDFFSPIQARQVKPEPIDAEILKLAPLAAMDNVAGSAPRRIGKKTSFDGVRVNFKEWREEYVAYVRLAGNELKHPTWNLGAKDFLNAVVTGKHPLSTLYVQYPEEMKVRFINTVVSQYRQLAQRRVLADPQFAEFAKYVQQVKADRAAARLPVDAR